MFLFFSEKRTLIPYHPSFWPYLSSWSSGLQSSRSSSQSGWLKSGSGWIKSGPDRLEMAPSRLDSNFALISPLPESRTRKTTFVLFLSTIFVTAFYPSSSSHPPKKTCPPLVFRCILNRLFNHIERWFKLLLLIMHNLYKK